MEKEKHYQQLSREERHYLELQRKADVSLNKIGQVLGRHRSTLSRELARNSDEGDYQYRSAENKAKQRHKTKPKAKKMDAALIETLAGYLKRCWSPEQISGRLKKEGLVSVSHETIYCMINNDKKVGGIQYGYLRHQAKPYKKRYGKPDTRGIIPNRVDIDERPAIVADKTRLGDWEADTVIGKGHQGVLVTLTERVSKLNLAIPVACKEAHVVKEAIITALKPFKDWVHTITFDNGREFCQHQAIAQALDCSTYFAKPYSSWQRGLNENHNGLLRQYFPKHSPLNTATPQQVNEAIDELNHRPRKMLDYRTPWEVFKQMAGVHDDYFSSVALVA